MNLILVGLNYQTAPVELREQFYLADERLRAGLNQLCAAGLAEVVAVSTCNRLEITASVEDTEAGFAQIEDFLRAAHPMTVEELRAHLYYHEGREVVRHLMRVASGLESLIGAPPSSASAGQARRRSPGRRWTGKRMGRG